MPIQFPASGGGGGDISRLKLSVYGVAFPVAVSANRNYIYYLPETAQWVFGVNANLYYSAPGIGPLGPTLVPSAGYAATGSLGRFLANNGAYYLGRTTTTGITIQRATSLAGPWTGIASANNITSFAGRGNIILAGVNLAGDNVQLSIDNGLSFAAFPTAGAQVDSVFISRSGRGFAGQRTTGAIYYTDDFLTWNLVNISAITTSAITSIVQTFNNRLVATAAAGLVLFSDDDGLTWFTSDHTNGVLGRTTNCAHVMADNTLLIGCNNGVIGYCLDPETATPLIIQAMSSSSVANVLQLTSRANNVAGVLSSSLELIVSQFGDFTS